jgi:hypothetical protein
VVGLAPGEQRRVVELLVKPPRRISPATAIVVRW